VLGSLLSLLGVSSTPGQGKGQASPRASGHWSGSCSSPRVKRGASSCTESTEEGSTAVEEGLTPACFLLEEEALRSRIEEALAFRGERPAKVGSPTAEEAGAAPPRTAAPVEAVPVPPAPSASSSVLIEATLTLDEVCLAVCRVHATDRCGEVAARFIDEHSLKPCFKGPLTAWLKQAENDAETFPVVLEADLMDIRNRYG